MRNKIRTSTALNCGWMVGIVFFLLLLGSCQEEGLPDKEAAEVALRLVPDDPRHAALPLIGTQWQLIGFVDGSRERIKLANPAGDDEYLVVFEHTGEIRGGTSTNSAYGKYLLSKDAELLIIDFSNVTEINEVFDGPLFIESMNGVCSFKISSKGLALYYGFQKYLLFKPI